MTSLSSTPSEKKYIDQHTFGFGYINNFRTIKPKKGQPFKSCTIRVLRGPRNNIKHTTIDTIIPSNKVIELLERCGDAVTQKNADRVLVYFTIGDAYPETFEREGKTCCWEKGRLINIKMLKMDGHIMHTDTTDTQQPVDDTSVDCFELITRGIGYINKIFTPDGKEYKVCKISAMRGSKDDIEYTHFNLNIHNSVITGLLEQCDDAFNNKQSVFAAFTIKDWYPKTFQYQSGDKKGQTGCCNQGQLNDISMIWIDGYKVYPEVQVPVPEASTPEVPAPEASTPEVPAPEASTPEVPAPEASTPEVPAPEASTPEVPVPEKPASSSTSRTQKPAPQSQAAA
ncbi:TPA: DUF3577 domain-containing protein [Salmonella enterica]|nr:DUF3577 domain-containing protein [Salmonella enterica]